MRALPPSSKSSAEFTALRTAPLVFGPILLQSSKASSMTLASVSVDMVAPAIAAAVCRGQGGGCQATIARLSLPLRRNVHELAIRVPEPELDRAGTQRKRCFCPSRRRAHAKNFRRKHFFLLRPFDHRARPFRPCGRER